MKTVDIFDCWFESGAVPMAQYHYPFENVDKVVGCEYLGDFVAEGLDQTRGWFYTLMVLSTALFDKPPFKTAICTGMILDESGMKFSKKSGNFKDPMGILNKYGADTLRLYLLSSPSVKAEPLLFNEGDVDKTKHRLIPYINAVRFFLEHTISFIKGNGNEFDPDAYNRSANITDKWIISRLATLLEYVKVKFEGYLLDSIVRGCLDFIEDLTNWYIKFNRDRLKGHCGTDESAVSLSTLFRVLITYCKITAPITPYLSECIYAHLKELLPENMREESVHLCGYPTVDNLKQLTDVETKFLRIQQVSKAIRKLRSMSVGFSSIKVPIKTVTIVHCAPDADHFIGDIQNFEDFIAEELNCLNLEYKKSDSGCMKYSIVFNNKSLGKKYRSQANAIKENISKIGDTVLKSFANGETKVIELLVNGSACTLTHEDFQIVPQFKPTESSNILSVTDGPLTVMIDTTYDASVHSMYQIRRFIYHVQNMRKISLLRPWDSITVYVLTDNDVFINLLREHGDRIFQRLKSNVVVIESESQIRKIHFSKHFDWNYDMQSDEVAFVPVLIERCEKSVEALNL
jgi:isoleucyl-tRNA synthetase